MISLMTRETKLRNGSWKWLTFPRSWRLHSPQRGRSWRPRSWSSPTASWLPDLFEDTSNFSTMNRDVDSIFRVRNQGRNVPLFSFSQVKWLWQMKLTWVLVAASFSHSLLTIAALAVAGILLTRVSFSGHCTGLRGTWPTSGGTQKRRRTSSSPRTKTPTDKPETGAAKANAFGRVRQRGSGSTWGASQRGLRPLLSVWKAPRAFDVCQGCVRRPRWRASCL